MFVNHFVWYNPLRVSPFENGLAAGKQICPTTKKNGHPDDGIVFRVRFYLLVRTNMHINTIKYSICAFAMRWYFFVWFSSRIINCAATKTILKAVTNQFRDGFLFGRHFVTYKCKWFCVRFFPFRSSLMKNCVFELCQLVCAFCWLFVFMFDAAMLLQFSWVCNWYFNKSQRWHALSLACS